MRPLELLFVVALVLYSWVIVRQRIRHGFTSGMVLLFGAGWLADVSGTILLCATSASSWHWTLHTITGLASLVIMSLHLGWALAARQIGGAALELFHRFSIYAWLLWLVSFVSGIPLH